MVPFELLPSPPISIPPPHPMQSYFHKSSFRLLIISRTLIIRVGFIVSSPGTLCVKRGLILSASHSEWANECYLYVFLLLAPSSLGIDLL